MSNVEEIKNNHPESNSCEVETKKAWHTPEFFDLDAKETNSGTQGNNDGAANWYNLS